MRQGTLSAGSRPWRLLLAAIVWLLAGVVVDAVAAEIDYQWNLPPGVPAPRIPASAVMTPASVELGRHLFYDQRLSGNGTQSCASCHRQELAFTDGRARGLGSTGKLHPRSPMSLVNVAYRDALTWANPTLRTLEKHVLIPMLGEQPVELGMLGHEDRIYGELARDPVYRKLFATAFPRQRSAVNRENVVLALVAFQRSIVSFQSPFDRYRYYGETGALSAAAERGMHLFLSQRARCSACHMAHNVPTLGLNLDGGSKTTASLVSEPEVFFFHNTGVYASTDALAGPPDHPGLYETTGVRRDIGKFRIPTLRNVAVTAPYMHDGSIATLEAVLDHYVAGGRAPNPQQSPTIQSLILNPQERKDLIAFLESLTDQEVRTSSRWSDPWKK